MRFENELFSFQFKRINTDAFMSTTTNVCVVVCLDVFIYYVKIEDRERNK